MALNWELKVLEVTLTCALLPRPLPELEQRVFRDLFASGAASSSSSSVSDRADERHCLVLEGPENASLLVAYQINYCLEQMEMFKALVILDRSSHLLGRNLDSWKKGVHGRSLQSLVA